ncbi:MAG: hypothetical protein IK100_09635 [Muribaculaceae bacterium]|nr:hypothetical protein [Muribaculaceae bacterium]
MQKNPTIVNGRNLLIASVQNFKGAVLRPHNAEKEPHDGQGGNNFSLSRGSIPQSATSRDLSRS